MYHGGRETGETEEARLLANIVAFTGNPVLVGDSRYLVNAQLRELDVVSAVPGLYPEKELLISPPCALSRGAGPSSSQRPG